MSGGRGSGCESRIGSVHGVPVPQSLSHWQQTHHGQGSAPCSSPKTRECSVLEGPAPKASRHPWEVPLNYAQHDLICTVKVQPGQGRGLQKEVFKNVLGEAWHILAGGLSRI